MAADGVADGGDVATVPHRPSADEDVDRASLPPFAPASDPLARVPLYPEEVAAAAKPLRVAVTGATGFVAGAVVARLLASGHTVHATVRDPSNEAALAPLRALPGAGERLSFFAADLLQAGSFDAALAGCDLVMHTASPFVISVKPGEARSRLVEPAVRGVEHVLAAVDRTPSVRRVVMTSSVAAVLLSDVSKTRPGVVHVYDESHWNTIASETVLPYAYSKTAAERRAWELASAQSRWSLVTILPSLVLGPPVSGRTDSESVALVMRMMGGEMWPAAPWAGLAAVDARDVAAAHCLAGVHPGATGRYIVSGDSTMLHRLPALAAQLYPGGRVAAPLFFLPKWLVWLLAPLAGLPRDAVTYSLGMLGDYRADKAQRELGLGFVRLATSLRDMIEDLAARGIIRHPKPELAVPAAAAAVAGAEGAAKKG